MATESLLWTALPNGLTDDRQQLRLSVMVAPRLNPDGSTNRLSTFDHFLDWPATLANARFRFLDRPATPANAPPSSTDVSRTLGDVDGTLDVPNSQTWTQLFRPTTRVTEFTVPDRSATEVLSYDTVASDVLIRGIYAKLVTAGGDDLPTMTTLLTEPALAGVHDAVEALDREFVDQVGGLTRETQLRHINAQFDRYRTDSGVKMRTPLGTLFATAQLFHTPMNTPTVQRYTEAQVGAGSPRLDTAWRSHATKPLPTADELVKAIDFHQIVSAMNQYPRLLRRLGLVLDFTFPVGTFVDGADRVLQVEVTLPESVGVEVRHASPRVHALVSSSRFQPKSSPAPGQAENIIKDGLLSLDERFALLQTDVDGAMLKLMNFSRSIALRKDPERRFDRISQHEDRAGAPALRSAGLMLVQRRRGVALRDVFKDGPAREKRVQDSLAGQPGAVAPDLYWEDLTRGFRIDIWDRTTQVWRSLCERTSHFDIAGGLEVIDVEREEGLVRLAATSAADGSRPNIVSLHEAVTAWQGWSLVARPPGRTIDPKDTPADGEADVPSGIPMRTAFRPAPGSLPRLRYGRFYAMRARAVDLAGNSLAPSLDDYADEKPAERGTTFHRLEPIPGPVLALVSSGGAVDAPAEGESMGTIAVRSFNDTFDAPTPSEQAARRFVVPTRTTAREAERHGMFDAAGALDPGAYATMVARDRDLPAVELSLTGGAPHAYAVHDAVDPLPYLPDPFASVIAARFLHHPQVASDDVIRVPLYQASAWPDAQPFTIRVYEDDAGVPHYDEAQHTLMVPCPKATRALLRLSCVPSDEMLEQLGVWNWVPAAQRATWLTSARLGRLWAITPWTTLEIVHATQRPLLAPDLADLTLSRGRSDTFAHVGFRAACSIKSTARVDLRAQWHEPRDVDDAPSDLPKTDHAYSVKITDPQSYGRGEPGALLLDADFQKVGEDAILVPGQTNRERPAHEFGDTRYRRIEYQLVATTRFREFMPPDILSIEDESGGRVPTEDKLVVPGAKQVAWIPSSAPPPAPEVLYVVPTYGWTRGTDDTGRATSWRRGRGLRVYLNRPWCVTGYGEMLAVVLPPTPTPANRFSGDPNTSLYKNFVTQWGNDPVWASSNVTGVAPKRNDFPLARTTADPTGAWLPSWAPPTESDQPPVPFEVAGLEHPAAGIGATVGVVEIAPHDVFYDEERALWYSDVEVNIGASYSPFIRLALARYQPVSCDGCHLSTIVLADIMAVSNDRWLSVSSPNAAGQRRVRVDGWTHKQSSGHAEAHRFSFAIRHPTTGVITEVVPSGIAKQNVIEVWVERLDPTLGEDFGWSRIPGVEVTPPPPVLTPGRPVAIGWLPRPLQAQIDTLSRGRQFEAVVAQGLLREATAFLKPLFEANVTLPSEPSPTQRLRLVVAEYEEYLVDDETPYVDPPQQKRRRLVFVEHIELS